MILHSAEYVQAMVAWPRGANPDMIVARGGG
jgi:hypothetical protein